MNLISSRSPELSSVIDSEGVLAVRILLAEDHAIVRQGIRLLVPEEISAAVIGEACDAAGALRQLRAQTWDLMLLDVNLPGRSGLDLLKDITAEFPELPVLMYSALPDEEYGVIALKAGAAGYINKASELSELVKAVKTVLAGHKYVGPALAEQLAKDVTGMAGPPHTRLSEREFEVLRLIATGKALKEIAADLSLSVKTISTYRVRTLHKMGLQTNADLVRYVLQHLPSY